MDPKHYYIVLNLPNNHEGFDHFYNENKTTIYKSIIDLFKGFITTKKMALVLHIESMIDGFKWDTDFVFSNKQTYVLTKDILPHFEDMNDFDTCIEIRDLCKKLNEENILVDN